MSEDSNPSAIVDDAYDALLTDLRAIITTGRVRAAVAVNAELVMTYWKIGERIVREEQGGREHAGYGTRLLARLGRTLNQEFGRALNERNLQQMRQFYVTYPNANALRSELTWTHYRTLMRLPSERRVFYEQLAATGRWSSRELERQINSMLYERTGLSGRPEELASSLPQPGRAVPVRRGFPRPVSSRLRGVLRRVRRARSGKGARGQHRKVLKRIKVAHVPASRQPGGAEGAPGPTQRRL